MLPKMLTKNVNKENVNKKILHKMMHWFHGHQTANPAELKINVFVLTLQNREPFLIC